MPHSSIESPTLRRPPVSEQQKIEAYQIGILVGAITIKPAFLEAVLQLHPDPAAQFRRELYNAASQSFLEDPTIVDQLISLPFLDRTIEDIKRAMIFTNHTVPHESLEEKVKTFAAQLDRQVFGRKTPRKG